MPAPGLWLALIAQASAPVVDPKADIVVEARRQPDAPAARRFADTLTRRAESTIPFARFTTPVCVGAVGLPVPQLEAISDRIVRVAIDAGIAVADAGCRPTILVVFADAPAAAIERLRLRSAGLFGNLSLDEIRHITARKGAAYGWTTAQMFSRDGQPAVNGVVRGYAVSAVHLPFRRDMIASVVLFDRAAIVGRGIESLADYAAMRALTGADPIDARGTDSILTLFDGGVVPDRLTPLDAAFLRGYYAGAGNVTALMKRGQIATAMATPSKRAGR